MADLKTSPDGLVVRSTAQAAAEWLRQAIMRGDLKPGERLIEHKLAARLGIGQPTLREGLKELELQGFVRKSPKRGTFVTKLGEDDFRQSLEVRLALEVPAIERASVKLTEEQFRRLEECIDGMERAVDRFALEDFHENDVRFHETIWEAADNEFLRVAVERAAFGLFAFVLLQRNPGDKGEFQAAAAQHREILNGLRTKDPAKARAAYLDSTLRFWNDYHGLGVAIADGFTSALSRTN